MGGEMMYILEQRLTAQKVTTEKASKILNDSIKTLFSPQFIEQLFEPQKIFSIQYTKQIFNKVVHSSIMTLNESSMNKLFDLMLMGFKYQIIASNFPQAVYHITMNHLDGIQKVLKDNSSVKLIENARKVFRERYATLNSNDYLMIRRELLRYMQDKTIRVSVFLQDEIQNIDGRIIVDNSGFGAIGAEMPGKVRYYSEKGDIIKMNHFDLKSGELFIENKTTTFTEPIKTTLGSNLYAIERPKQEKSTSKEKDKDKGKISEPKPQTMSKPIQKMDLNPEAAKRELNMLAALIKGSEKQDDKETLDINLFPEPIKKSGGGPQSEEEYAADVIVFETTTAHQQQRIKNILGDFDDVKGSQTKKQDAGDDLLDLMDSAV